MNSAWLVVAGGGSFALVALIAVFAPRVVRRGSPAIVLALAAAGAVLGALAPGAPTRIAALDAVLRAGFGAACVIAAASTRPVPRLVASAVVAIPPFVATGGGLPALLALGAAAATVALGVDGAALGAAVGLGIGQAALRLGWPATTGLTALVALGALLVLAVPVVRRARPATRRRLLVPLALVGGAAVVIVFGYAALVLLARGNVNQGIDSANAGLAAARHGDTQLAARDFDLARQAFADANSTLDGWWGKPVLVIPGAAQQARALSRMSAIGIRLAASGAQTSRAADPSATRLTGGTVPLDKIAALEPPLSAARRSLVRSGAQLRAIDATWLVAPLDNKLTNLEQRVAHAAHDTETAIQAARVVPELLGANGQTRRYFLAFQTPAEQRASGGIIGNFAVISFTNGHLELERSGRDGDLNAGGSETRTLVGPADYLRRYAEFQPETTWQNVTMSPDWPSVAQVVEGLYPQSGGEPVDGVISVDPTALAAFLKLTGPVRVEGLESPLTAKNAAQILLRDQYVKFADLQTRVDFLGNAVDAVIHRIQQGNLPGAARIGHVLGPMVKQGRIKLQSVDPKGEQFLARIHSDGALPSVRGDFAGLVTQNASGNKIDLFLHRSLSYDTVVDPATGTARSTATITLRNDAPTSGLPATVIAGSGPNPTPPGLYRGYVSFYTPLALQLALVNGQPALFDTSTERGRTVVSAMLDVPSGTSTTIRLDLVGPVRLPRTESGRRYRLKVWHQATIDPTALSVHISAARGAGIQAEQGLHDDGSALVGGRPVPLDQDFSALVTGN